MSIKTTTTCFSLDHSEWNTMETSHPQLPSHHRLCRRPRIILGVSGSVAAIKAPELAVQIVSDSYYGGGCELQIVLTKSGEYFWDRAAEYNPRAWKQFQQLQKQQPTESNHSSSPAIPIHRTFHATALPCHKGQHLLKNRLILFFFLFVW